MPNLLQMGGRLKADMYFVRINSWRSMTAGMEFQDSTQDYARFFIIHRLRRNFPSPGIPGEGGGEGITQSTEFFISGLTCANALTLALSRSTGRGDESRIILR
jgi:hypothetical protein